MSFATEEVGAWNFLETISERLFGCSDALDDERGACWLLLVFALPISGSLSRYKSVGPAWTNEEVARAVASNPMTALVRESRRCVQPRSTDEKLLGEL